MGLIHQLATLPEHPESVPINRLVAIKVRHNVPMQQLRACCRADGLFLQPLLNSGGCTLALTV